MNAAQMGTLVDRAGWAVLSASASGTVLAVLLVAAAWLFRRQLSPAWRHALWLVVLVRLLLPAVPVGRFHPLAIANLASVAPAADAPETLPVAAFDGDRPKAAMTAFRKPVEIRFEEAQALSPATAAPATALDPIRIFACLWIAGMLVYGAWTLAAAARLAGMLRGCREVTDPRALATLEACRAQLGLRCRVRLCVAPDRLGPALAGIWRPRIILPRDWADALDGRQLHFVLLHELAHLRRRDPWAHAVALVARGVHWFNPAVWLVARRMQLDCELATDDAVLRAIGPQNGSAYGHTILHLVEHFIAPQPATFGISDRRWLRRRIATIAAFGPAKPMAWVAGLALFAVLAAVGWTRADDDPPPEQPELKLAAKKETPAAPLDEATQQQVENALEVLRTYTIRQDDIIWTSALRDLIEIGEPAVPLLTVELDKTTRNETIRGLGFVLRGIGDPRAIPALIRALPRTLLPSSNDYGLLVEDPDLLKFLREHDMDARDDGKSFSYGRPFREVVAALRKLTGTKHWEMEINFVHLAGSAQQVHLMEDLYRQVTRTWAHWWSENWQRYLTDPAGAEIDLTLAAAEPPRETTPPALQEFPVGPNVATAGSSSNRLLPPFTLSRSYSCLDLDTGRQPKIPAELVRAGDRMPSDALLAWAAREGVDLIGIQRTPPDGKSSGRWMVPVGLRLREIGNTTRVEIVEDVRDAKQLRLIRRTGMAETRLFDDLKQGRRFEMPPAAATEIPYGSGRYAFITREGATGIISFNPEADQVEPPGLPARADRGMRYQYIFEKP